MGVDLTWLAVGMGGAFVAASLISVGLGGPGWPFFLGLGGLCLVAAFVMGLRPPQDDD